METESNVYGRDVKIFGNENDSFFDSIKAGRHSDRPMLVSLGVKSFVDIY